MTYPPVNTPIKKKIIIGSIFSHNKQVIEEIKRRSIKAETKSKFIANMGHDLHTPITGMLGMLQDMLNTADKAKFSLEQEQSEMTSTRNSSLLKNVIATVQRDGQFLVSATDELLQLCNEILEIIRLESDNPIEHLESFNVRELIEHNIELFQPTAQHKKLDLSLEIAKDVPNYLSGLRIYLDRILLNLIGNALKFTNGGFVKIKVNLLKSERTPHRVNDPITLKILVEDSGIGIPEDKFEMIFEHFAQLTPTYTGLYKGIGLGLYTVKHYVEAMGGKISITSK